MKIHKTNHKQSSEPKTATVSPPTSQIRPKFIVASPAKPFVALHTQQMLEVSPAERAGITEVRQNP